MKDYRIDVSAFTKNGAVSVQRFTNRGDNIIKLNVWAWTAVMKCSEISPDECFEAEYSFLEKPENYKDFPVAMYIDKALYFCSIETHGKSFVIALQPHKVHSDILTRISQESAAVLDFDLELTKDLKMKAFAFTIDKIDKIKNWIENPNIY